MGIMEEIETLDEQTFTAWLKTCPVDYPEDWIYGLEMGSHKLTITFTTKALDYIEE